MPIESGMESKWLQLAGTRNQKVHTSSKMAATSQPRLSAALRSAGRRSRLRQPLGDTEPF